MNGHKAFDMLVEAGLLDVHEPIPGTEPWASITKLPKNIEELDLLVRCVKVLGAWSVPGQYSDSVSIEVRCGSRNDQILFRKVNK